MWDFYSGRSIFLTGGTGFLGSTLLYRLLKKADTGKIFIICRGGKGRAEKKWKQHLTLEMAEELLSCESIVFLDGDLTKESMGLRDEELDDARQETRIIIHGASSINLTSPLERVATEIIGPSVRLAQFGISCPKLEKFVFVSSAFANSHLWKSFGGQEIQLDEMIYPLASGSATHPTAWETWQEIQNTGTCEELHGTEFPFAYAYAKHLSERLLLELFHAHKTGKMLLIIRPAIIGPAQEFPFPQFCHPFSTPVASFCAGLLAETNPDVVMTSTCDSPTFDQVPVDVVTDRLLAHLGIGTGGIVHVTSPRDHRISIDDFLVCVNRARRLPGEVAIQWERDDLGSPRIYPLSRLFVLTGTSFNFGERNTENIAHLDGKNGLQLFTRAWVWPRASEVQQIARKFANAKGLLNETAGWVCGEQLTIDGLRRCRTCSLSAAKQS